MPLQFDYSNDDGVIKSAAYAVAEQGVLTKGDDGGFNFNVYIYWDKAKYDSDPTKYMDKITAGCVKTDPAYDTLKADPATPDVEDRAYNYLVTRTDKFPNAQIVA